MREDMQTLKNPVSRGFALTAVLIVMALLLALLAPFMLGIGQGLGAASESAGEAENRINLLGARGQLFQSGALTQGSLDQTPTHDGLDEFPTGVDLGGSRDRNDAQENPLASAQVLGGDSEDLQGRIHAPTAPLMVWANLLGLWSTLSRDLEVKETGVIEVDDPSRFDEEGWVWIGQELIHYGQRTDSGLEDLTRGVNAGPPELPPDPFGPPASHNQGSFVVDARCRLLVTWQFDEGGTERKEWRPWTSLEELTRVSEMNFGELTLERVEKLGNFLAFAGARPVGSSFGPKERVFNELLPGMTNALVVKDAHSMPRGSTVRITAKDGEEWALVVAHRPGHPGLTTVRTRTMWTIVLDRPVQLEAQEGEARVEPLLPVPVNLNTARKETLAFLIEGLRQRTRATQGDHAGMPRPVSRSVARALAEAILAERSPTEDQDFERPFEHFEALTRRVFVPMMEEGALDRGILFYLERLLMHGSWAGHWHAGIPVCFDSAGLVAYRVAGALRTGAGVTRAHQERTGNAFLQPGRAIDRFYATQAMFEEAARIDRKHKYWQTWPINTSVRWPRGGGEPPDSSVAYVLPYLHGKEFRFPSEDPEKSWTELSIARAPVLGRGNTVFSFETSPHPEGHDVKADGLFSFDGGVPAPGGRITAKALYDTRRRLPMFLDDGNGLGMAFGFSAWFKPRSLNPAILFDVSAGEAFRNRVTLSLEKDQLVFRAFDMGGIDPDPGLTSPEETALVWSVPIAENAIEADLWFHAAFELAGFRPEMISVTTDGAVRGKPHFLSYSANEIPEIDLRDRGLAIDEKEQKLFPRITVEDAETFPEAGVVQIGEELFDYTAKDGNNLVTERRDSMGGRMDRRDPREFRKVIDPDELTPGEEPIQIKLPRHPAGAAVKLYGYSSPLVQDTVLPPGEGGLLSKSLRPWGVARVITEDKPIDLLNYPLGQGIDENFSGKLQFVDPVLPASTRSTDSVPGFDEGGGWALLIQDPWELTYNMSRSQSITELVGGVELVHYGSADASSITIDRRAQEADPDLRGGVRSWFRGAQGAHKFVTNWNRVFQNVPDPNELPQLWTFCVPVSLGISGLSLVDPALKGERAHSEWVQVYPKGTEAHTEWVRYDHVIGSHILRTRMAAVRRLLRALTTDSSIKKGDITGRGGQINRRPGTPIQWREVPRGNPDEIGTPSTKELPASYAARLAFRFRGDANRRTATHDQSSDSIVTPVFRTVLGSLALGRPARGDRVALITGIETGSQPMVEWNTVHWAKRQWITLDAQLDQGGGDTTRGGQSRLVDPQGPRGNLVALKFGVGVPFHGSAFRTDTRYLDRIVKFPSGELPMNLQGQATVGGSQVEDLSMDGIVDDVMGYTGRRWNPISIGDDGSILGILAVEIDDTSTELDVRHGDNPSFMQLRELEGGGLLLLEGEVMGFKSYDRATGRIELAANGRGLLGTEPRPHDVGGRVQFLSSRPATYLSSAATASQEVLEVANNGRLPLNEGTVLIGTELIHYCWTRDAQFLEMPAWDPGSGQQGSGLFRGRYGTKPTSHAEEDMVISWPIRYWDRYRELSDDPELSHFDITTDAYDLYLTEVLWEEEIPDTTLDLELLLRADERVPFSADPDLTPWLWRFREPERSDGEPGHRILKQASRWDFRFQVRYLSGAFDPSMLLGRGWKMTPKLRTFGYTTQGATRILSEELTLR